MSSRSPLSRLLFHFLGEPKTPFLQISRKISTSSYIDIPHPTSTFTYLSRIHFSTSSPGGNGSASNTARKLPTELEREKQREREARQRKGFARENDWDGSDESSGSERDEDDDHRFSEEAVRRRTELFEKKHRRHKELLDNFTRSETLDDAFKWMKRIDKFEERHFKLRPEYRVIGELMNRLKVAEGKDKFILQHKINRALRLVTWREKYDPNNPANYGFLQQQQRQLGGHNVDQLDDDGSFERQEQKIQEDSDEDEFDDLKERDNLLVEKLNAIDQKLEEKLAELDHTFGKKGKLLEEEIRNLAEERNELTEKKIRPMYREGFDVKLIDVNRTCKVTKGGQVTKYSAILVCGNYHGVIGFAKAKGLTVPVALRKAHEKCFQNLHYVERHEEHTIAHAIQTNYKKCKLYLWPASTKTGMKAGKNVQTILSLAGFQNVKSKVIGSRNPYNTVKAVFKALNAIETPKDVQEKFGRTVVQKYLL